MQKVIRQVHHCEGAAEAHIALYRYVNISHYTNINAVYHCTMMIMADVNNETQ